MRTTRMRTAVIALATAGLMAAGGMAYAKDDVIGIAGGPGGTAVSGANQANGNGASSGAATSNGGFGGTADNNQTAACGGSSGGGGGLIGIGDVNVCPNVGPVLSSQKGGDANGGTSRSGSVEQDNNSSSTASADGGNASNGSSQPAKAKKHKKSRGHGHHN